MMGMGCCFILLIFKYVVSMIYFTFILYYFLCVCEETQKNLAGIEENMFNWHLY